MICNNCKVENNNSSLYCYNCGCQLNTDVNNNVIIKSNVDNSRNANISLTCGIICLVMAFILNILCFIPGIISIIYAFKYKKESGKLGVGFGLSLGGMIYSFVLFLIYLFFILIFIGAASSVNDYDNEYYDEYDTEYTYNLSEV